ncbi:MAG: carbohydrate kinase [Microcoleaceae cyanobacterium]
MRIPRVLSIGEMLWDRLSNQPGKSLDEVESWTDYPGGAPANVVCGVVKLGTPAGLISCIGQDSAGDGLIEVLQTVGVDQSGVQRHLSAPTRVVYVTPDFKGNPTFAGFGNNPPDGFADAQLQATRLPMKALQQAEFLVTGTLSLAYPSSREALAQAILSAAQYGTRICIDINRRDVFWPEGESSIQVIRDLIQFANFLKLTEAEAEWLFHTTDPAAIASTSRKLLGVFVTAAEQGCHYWMMGHSGTMAAFSVAVVDTTGAGDGFTAGILHQLCQQGISAFSTPEAVTGLVRYATAVAALTVTQPGAIAAQPTASEVEAFLLSQTS